MPQLQNHSHTAARIQKKFQTQWSNICYYTVSKKIKKKQLFQNFQNMNFKLLYKAFGYLPIIPQDLSKKIKFTIDSFLHTVDL